MPLDHEGNTRVLEKVVDFHPVKDTGSVCRLAVNFNQSFAFAFHDSKCGTAIWNRCSLRDQPSGVDQRNSNLEVGLKLSRFIDDADRKVGGINRFANVTAAGVGRLDVGFALFRN